MELFGVGWILRYCGFWAYLGWLFIASLAGAILGLHYAKKNNDLGLDDRYKILANIIKYALFLLGVWFVTFGVQFAMNKPLVFTAGYTVLAIVLALLLSWLLTVDSETRLIDREAGVKTFFFIIFTVGGSLVTAIIWDYDMPIVSLTKEERASYTYTRLMKEGEDYTDIFPRIERLGTRLHPYFLAIAEIRIHKRQEAATHFREYATSVPTEQRLLYFAFREFYLNHFATAEEHFKSLQMKQYALLCRFRNDKLTLADIKEYAESSWFSEGDADLISRMRGIVLTSERLRSNLSEAPGPENTNILQELLSLKAMIQDLKKSDEKSQSTNSEVTSKYNRIMRHEIESEIERRMIALVIERAPSLPFPHIAEFNETWQRTKNIWAVMISFGFFLGSLLTVAYIWRDYRSGIAAFVRAIGITKLARHSRYARSIALELTQLEPRDAKGLFSEEIKSIRNALFPFDIFVALSCRRKVRAILRTQRMETQEGQDIKFIHALIRKRSGQLIPYGDAQVLSIITALRDRADTSVANYQKDKAQFLVARDELLAIQKEFIALGDILDAFNKKPGLTHYHILGLDPHRDTPVPDIKKAYHGVMRAVHPDHNPNNIFVENLAKLATEAYATLSNPNRRKAYEAEIRL